MPYNILRGKRCDSASSAAYKKDSVLCSVLPFCTPSPNNPKLKQGPPFLSLPAILYCRRNDASDRRFLFPFPLLYTQCSFVRSPPPRLPRKVLVRRDLLLLQSLQVIRSFFGEANFPQFERYRFCYRRILFRFLAGTDRP